MKTWQAEFDVLWKRFVPKSGQAATVQGELLRAIGRISDEAFRNGNVNWDEDYGILCRFLRETLLDDASVFSPAELTAMRNALSKIDDPASPDVSSANDPYYLIAEKVVKWCRAHPGAVSRPLDPELRR